MRVWSTGMISAFQAERQSSILCTRTGLTLTMDVTVPSYPPTLDVLRSRDNVSDGRGEVSSTCGIDVAVNMRHCQCFHTSSNLVFHTKRWICSHDSIVGWHESILFIAQQNQTSTTARVVVVIFIVCGMDQKKRYLKSNILQKTLNPSYCRIYCACDATGRHNCMRCNAVWVRIPPGAPMRDWWNGIHTALRTQVLEVRILYPVPRAVTGNWASEGRRALPDNE
jgi:hypothetical protein